MDLKQSDLYAQLERWHKNNQLDLTPFRSRTETAWSAFLAGEKDLRAMLDGNDLEAVTARCAELLSSALSRPAFELGARGGEYELILSPEGDRTRLFQLIYFQQHAPRDVLEHWNVLVGRTRSPKGFHLRMCGQDIGLEDVQVWAEKTEDNGVGLKLYCPKLAACLEQEEQIYSILCILLDQALGELAAMRYVDYLDVLDAPEAGEPMGLDQLADYIAQEVDPEHWDRANDPAFAGKRFTAYGGKPDLSEPWSLRQDVIAGSTCCVPLLKLYYQGDGFYMDRLHRDGVVSGFFYYPLDRVPQKETLDLRDRLEAAVLARAGTDAVFFTGGATGVKLGYLDFLAWDLKAVLDAAAEVFRTEPRLSWAAFHTFRRDGAGIGLKREEDLK